MKVIFLGTNGWYTSPTGNTACVLVDSKSHYVIFDAGNGIYKIGQYITESKPIVLFISHFHIDHVSGFHTLSKFDFPQGIDVYFAKGRRRDFEVLVNRPYTISITWEKENISNLDTKIRLHEIAEGTHDVGFEVEIRKLSHAYQDHGYRVNLEGKTIVYSGDTGVCDAGKKLAENANLLIHECSLVKTDKDEVWGHVEPEQAAEIAKEAKAKQLVLTHFDASLYQTLESREIAQNRARKIFPNTIAATDDMILAI